MSDATTPEPPDLDEVFAAALECGTAEARAEHLDAACAGHPDLRARVESLLAAYGDAGSFLDLDDDPAADLAAVAEKPGDRIGRYRLLQVIGEGGFGVVHMAEQEEPVRRRVALKILKLGMDTKQVLARFEAERQALAMTEHSNIARMLDAGATDTGRPYFVMELVRGVAINEFCDRNNLTPRQRLELMLPVCRAVEHAHRRGIIHRDLKPSNVLVTLHDGVPVPKVIDFGIAKATNQRLTERTLFTRFHQFIGTPEYMSPEQAEMSGLDVDTRTDVYALGVLLYELLTGTTPFDGTRLRGAGYDEIQRIIREEEPPRPSTRLSTLGGDATVVAARRGTPPEALGRLVRGDLDWIVMRALEKDRSRRYGSASDLAAEIERHLAGEPVEAGPPSRVYRLRKTVGRHRTGVAVASIVLAALVGGLAMSMSALHRARQSEDAARRAAAESEAIAAFMREAFASVDPMTAAGIDVDVGDLVERAREVFGDQHAAVAAALSSRALQLQNSGFIDEAESLHREALAAWESVDGPESPTVAAAHGRLGVVLELRGLGDEALASFDRAWRIVDGGGDATRVLAVCDPLDAYAKMLTARQRFAEAERVQRRSLAIRTDVAPTQYLELVAAMDNLCDTLLFDGRPGEAAGVLLDSVPVSRRLYPAESESLARRLATVGGWLVGRESYEQALPLFHEAVEIYREIEAPSWELHETALRFAQDLEESTGRRIDLLEERVAVARARLDPSDPTFAMWLFNRSRQYAEVGLFRTALDLAEESRAIWIAADDPTATNGHVLSGIGEYVWSIASRADSSLGDQRAAAVAMQSLLDTGRMDENPTMLVAAAAARYRTGDLAAAWDILQQSIAMLAARGESRRPRHLALLALVGRSLGEDAAVAEAMSAIAELPVDPGQMSSGDRRLVDEALGRPRS